MWDYFRRLNTENGCNYRYIMRMDEESFIHSKIEYNLFDKMRDNDWSYGYRSCSYEMRHVDKLFLKYQETQPAGSVVAKRDFVGQNLCGFYNNWFIADLQFFLSTEVQGFLRYADQSGTMYKHRSNDLILQTAAVYAFCDQAKVHRFLDFTYQHFTSYHDSGCPMWGSLATGHNDLHAAEIVNDFVHEMREKGCPREDEAFKFKVVNLPTSDLSPSYNHLSSHLANITLRHVKVGLVDVPGRGPTSG